MLQRIRVLAVQAANGTNTKSDRKALQEEVDQLCAEVTRIGVKTTFAGAQILDGKPAAAAGPNATVPNTLLDANGKIFFQVGANANDTLNLDLSKGFTFDGIIEGAKAQDIAANAGKYAKPGEPAAAAGKTVSEVKAESGIKISITQDNANPPNKTRTIGFSISEAALAQKTLETIDMYIQYVDSSRAGLGALQNRMESTIRNQASISENESDARSRIRDTDFASETAALTQNNIIQQASQTILSQANQRPMIALSLLGR